MKKGFTLVELIIILVMIGILAVFVAPKVFNISNVKEEADIIKFITAVRYAQHKSMIHGGGYGIKIESNNSNCKSQYSYSIIDNNGNPITLPGEDSNYICIENSISSDVEVIKFDYIGKPEDNSGYIQNNITININGKSVVITPNAGGVYEG